jgi:threonine/homoserine/homoserine lactone efflux protein
MFRSIIGFAVLAVMAWIGLSIILSFLGLFFGLAMKVLTLAAFGFIAYLAIRMISPRTADKIRDIIKGREA